TGGDDGTVRLWATDTGQPRGTLAAGGGVPVTSVAFDGDGGRLAVGHADGRVRLWEAAGGRSLGTFTAFGAGGGHPVQVAFDADGTLAVGYGFGVWRWDPATGRADHARYDPAGGDAAELAFDPAAGTLAVGG